MTTVTMTKYKSLYSDDIYFALLDPLTKTIDNAKYIEVTSSLTRIVPHFVRLDSITKVGKVEKEVR